MQKNLIRCLPGVLSALFILAGASACKKTLKETSPDTAPLQSSEKINLPTQSVASNLAESKAVSIAPEAKKCVGGSVGEWGNSTGCPCPEKFNYNPVSGLCDGYGPVPSGERPAKNPGVASFVPPGACSNDLNGWSNPSNCECPPKSWYNPVSARCDTKI